MEMSEEQIGIATQCRSSMKPQAVPGEDSWLQWRFPKGYSENGWFTMEHRFKI